MGVNFGPIPWQAAYRKDTEHINYLPRCSYHLLYAEIIGGFLATESQTPKGTQYTGWVKFFIPDFNKLPYSLHSQGDSHGLNKTDHLTIELKAIT